MSASGWVPPGAKFDKEPRKGRKGTNGNGHDHVVSPVEDSTNPYDDHQLPDVEWIDRRISDWNEAELPERLWVIPDWIPREQVTGLYGPPGVNKTDFLIQLLMSTSLGLPFLGYQLERMPAFGLFCEDTAVEIARRAARIASHHGMYLSEFPDFHYASLVGHDDLEFVTFERNSMYQTRALKRFDMTIQQTGAALACLDTAPHFFGGSEIDRRQVSRFLRKLDAISIVRGCGIVITAHPSAKGRDSGRMDSGSTGWEGGVRARIALTRPGQDDAEDGKPPADGKDRQLTLWKSNYSPPGKILDLVCDRGVFTTSALDPDKAKARGPLRVSMTDEHFKEMLPKIDKEGRYVSDSRSANDRYAPRVFAQHPDGKEFSEAEYRRAMQRLLAMGVIKLVPVSSKPSDQRRKLVINEQ
jgi:RecA-family ATPase